MQTPYQRLQHPNLNTGFHGFIVVDPLTNAIRDDAGITVSTENDNHSVFNLSNKPIPNNTP